MFAKAGGKSKSTGKASGTRWVTIRGHAVQIDGSGNILKGHIPGIGAGPGHNVAKGHEAHTAPGKSKAAAHKTAKSHHAELVKAGKGHTFEGKEAEARARETAPKRSPKATARIAKSKETADGARVKHAGERIKALGKHAEAHREIDRIARGHSKDELFAAAKHAGVEHGEKTKKGLVEHLKAKHAGGDAGKAAAKPAPAPAAKTPKPASKPAPKPDKARVEPTKSDKPAAASPAAHGVPRDIKTTFEDHAGRPLSRADVERDIHLATGKKLTIEEMAGLAGAPDGSHVHFVSSGKYNIRMFTDTPQVSSDRSVRRDEDGNLVIHNNNIMVKEGQRGAGIGSSVFGRQVDHAVRHGFHAIETTAGRDDSEKQIGYKVWPRLGYDGPIDGSLRSGLPKSLAKAKNVGDLMKTEAGRKWWDTHGDSTDMTFDLKPGSQSRKVWDAYQAEKAARAARS